MSLIEYGIVVQSSFPLGLVQLGLEVEERFFGQFELLLQLDDFRLNLARSGFDVFQGLFLPVLEVGLVFVGVQGHGTGRREQRVNVLSGFVEYHLVVTLRNDGLPALNREGADRRPGGVSGVCGCGCCGCRSGGGNAPASPPVPDEEEPDPPPDDEP